MKSKFQPAARRDDYGAKLELWAHHPVVAPLSAPLKLPHFGCKRFRSYRAFNSWKRRLLISAGLEG